MRKVVCFALLALSALAAHSVLGVRADLLDRGGFVKGSAVVTAIPGKVGIRVQVEVPPSLGTQRIICSVQRENGLGGGNVAIGSFQINSAGRGAGGGLVTVDPAWDVNGDGVIHIVIFVRGLPTGNALPFLVSDTLAVTLR